MSNENYKSEKIEADALLIFRDVVNGKMTYHFETGQRRRRFEKVQTVVAETGRPVWNIFQLQ